jgi:hypothetical protein
MWRADMWPARIILAVAVLNLLFLMAELSINVVLLYLG